MSQFNRLLVCFWALEMYPSFIYNNNSSLRSLHPFRTEYSSNNTPWRSLLQTFLSKPRWAMWWALSYQMFSASDNYFSLLKSYCELHRCLLKYTQKLAFQVGFHLQKKMYRFWSLQSNVSWLHTKDIAYHKYEAYLCKSA